MSQYKEKMEIEGIDQFGLLIEMLRVISENFHINLNELHITANNGVFTARLVLYVYDKAELYELMDSLKKMHNIQSVKRVFD
jgi:GTP pyrophosphokinase